MIRGIVLDARGAMSARFSASASEVLQESQISHSIENFVFPMNELGSLQRYDAKHLDALPGPRYRDVRLGRDASPGVMEG